MNKKHILLFIFPVLQAGFFALALFLISNQLILSIGFLFIAALFLNFSLHISIHYHVHFNYKSVFLNFILDCMYSALLVLPFHFYKMQHFNHHRYNNLLHDFTSTWKINEGGPVRRSFIAYSFFWIFRGGSFKETKNLALKDGDLKKEWLPKMRLELFFILCTCVCLALLNPFFLLYYLIMFYAGWCMIAMHNYGQHLPVKYGDTLAYSFYNKFYNFIFFNNGLHYEHHHKPGADYWELKSESAAKNKFPHLLDGFFIYFKKEKQTGK